MFRFAYGLVMLAGVLQVCALAGCTVRVDEPANPPRVEVDVDRPPKVDVDVDVKKTP
jgi:hypothetical protein